MAELKIPNLSPELKQKLQEIEQELKTIHDAGLSHLESVQNSEALQDWRLAHLSKKSAVMQTFRQLSQLPGELRPSVGQLANQAKNGLEAAFNDRAESIKQQELQQSLTSGQIDVTMPGRTPVRGKLHPYTQTMREIQSIFAEMGFQVFRSPEVELDEINFGQVNFPPHHPARDMQDTFFTTNPEVVLRTHTTPGQIHAMRANAPEPIRVILPGMCYRFEQISVRSEIQFNQIEVLAVGENITFGDLKGTLQDFVQRLFGENVRTRLRPNYFPFTEPSAEMDVECFVCGGKGCPICKGTGWLEVLGCGMVHPNVLRNGGYDPEKFSGFAAGMGTERITMLRHKIEDIRYFWGNDVRFLEQF
jgi:phenylalanyl-tRNA synthetase alpha chain